MQHLLQTQGKASASATPAKIIKLAVRSQENNASKEPWKSPSDTRSWSKLEHGHGSLGPIHIHSPRRTEGNSDLLGRLVIDEREQIEKSTKNKPLTASGLTVCELLKRKRKSEQTSQKEFQASVHGISDETGNLDSEKLETPAKETNLLKQTETNILRKSKASPRTKTQAEKTWHQMPKTRAQKKLYVQQSSRDSQKQNNEGSRLEKECLAKGNRSVESVGKEPKSVESEYSIENDDQRDDDDGFPQGDTDDDVISFTTDMYSDHDLSDTRIISIEPTVHEDIISRPEYYTKQVANHLDKSEFLHKKIFKMLTQDDKALEMDKHVESDKSIEEEKSNEDSGSPLDSTDNGYVYTMACSESAASAASTAQDCRGDMNVENNTPLQGNNADGTDPKSDENPTSTQIGSEMETKTGAQILYELSQRSFTRLVMGNNVQNCDGSQGEIQSSDIGPDGLTVSSEQIVPNENDTKETKAKRKIKSTKAVSHKKHESEVSFAQVGESAKIFLQKHPLLRGIYLNKGKREVKRNLIKLIRHKSAIDKGSYLRNGRINDKNRIDDMFEYTEDGLKKKEEIDENNARDEYVVNWYMWCPGHGNCLRKCGGYGHCVQG